MSTRSRFRAWLLACTFLFALAGFALGAGPVTAAVTSIDGANVDASTPPPPSGVCTTSFSMTSGGTLQFVETSAVIQFGLGVTEAFYDGQGYVTIDVLGGPNTRTLYQVSLRPLAILTSSTISTANSPDFTGSSGATHYNPFTARFVNVGRQGSAPCNITNCLHIRTFNNGLLASDIQGPTGLTAGTFLGSATTSTNTFLQYTGTGGVRIGNYTSGYAESQSVVVDAVNPAQGLAADSTFVYGGFGTNVIKRWTQSNLLTLTNFTTAFTSSGIRQVSLDGNFLYIPARGDGISTNNMIYKVTSSNPSAAPTGSVTLGVSQFVEKVLTDTVNNKLYIVVMSGTTQLQLVRVDRTSLTIEATYNGPAVVNGPVVQYANIDVPTQSIYVPLTGGGGLTAALHKVNLCT